MIILSAELAGTNAFAQMLGPQFAPAEQLLVLKNGEVLRGQITRNAEQVILLTEQGSRLVLPTERTDFVCNSMDEAYWGKVARTKASDLLGHKDLFHWCLKNSMLGQAQNQIDILLQLKTKAVDLEYLDRQLTVALIQRKSRNRQLALASQAIPDMTSAKPESEIQAQRTQRKNRQMALAPIQLDDSIGARKFDGDTSVAPVFRPLPSLNEGGAEASDSQFAQLPPLNGSAGIEDPPVAIRQVNFEEAIEFDTISLDRKISSQSQLAGSVGVPEPVDDRIMIPVHELDRETRSMPDGSLGHYRKKVERVLTNGCSAAKCHDADSRVMPLLQFSRSQPIPRRQSQRNLHNVVKYVDRVHPFESRLLVAAMTPHAGNEKPIFDKGSQHHENLLRWLIMLSDDPQRAVLEAIQSERQSTPAKPVANEHAQVLPIEPEPDGLMARNGSSLEFPDTIGEIPRLDAVKAGFTPTDPFDPEIFNRKFGK